MLDYLEAFAQWLKDLLLWLPLKLWEMLLDGLASVIEALPVPDFLAAAQGLFSGVGGNVLYVLGLFAVPEGIGMIISALILRFIIRRIPLIG